LRTLREACAPSRFRAFAYDRNASTGCSRDAVIHT
jgi:hypothetical protein